MSKHNYNPHDSERIDEREVVHGPDRGLSGREYTYQTPDLGEHRTQDAARLGGEGNPAVSERQRAFMRAEYGRAKRGEPTVTGMSVEKLRHFIK